MLFAVQFFAASICFADDFLTKGVRDEYLFISVPATWTVEEYGSLDDDADMIEAGEQAFKILDLNDGDDAKQGEMWIYAEPLTYDSYYCNTEEKAQDYYYESGEAAVDAFIETAFPDADSWSTEADFIRGEDAFTYVVRVNTTIEKKDYLIYLACDYTENGGIHEILIFEGSGDVDTRDRIAESIEGYGYAVELIDSREYSIDGGSDYTQYGDIDDIGIDVEKLIVAFIWIVIWIAVIIFAVKTIKSVRSEKNAGPVRGGFGQKKPARDRSARKSIDKWVFREAKSGHPDHQKHDDCLVQGGSKYTGYRESLKTLHKSGLLTTREMNELLEKHKNDL